MDVVEEEYHYGFYKYTYVRNGESKLILEIIEV